MERLGKVEGELVVSGEHPGLPNQQIPLWEIGSNVLFDAQAVRPAPGQLTLFVQPDTERVTGTKTLYLEIAGIIIPAVVWGTRTKLYVGVTPSTPIDATRLVGGPYTGTYDDTWSFVQFGQAVLATNGKDEVQYLAPGAVNFVDLSGPSDLPNTFRCRLLANTSAYVLAINTDNADYEVRWCDEDDPLTWVPTATNSARDLQVRSIGSPIAAVELFATGHILVGSDRAEFLQFIGPPFFFGTDSLVQGAAAISKNAVITFDRVAYGFGPNMIWESDGASLREISAPSVKAHIFEELYDQTRAEQLICWCDPDNTEIFWSFPTLGGQGKTVSYNRTQRLWAMHAYWRTAASRAGLWFFPITGSPTGGIFGQGGGTGQVSGNQSPIGLSEFGVISAGYGSLRYGNLAYGGFFSF